MAAPFSRFSATCPCCVPSFLISRREATVYQKSFPAPCFVWKGDVFGSVSAREVEPLSDTPGCADFASKIGVAFFSAFTANVFAVESALAS